MTFISEDPMNKHRTVKARISKLKVKLYAFPSVVTESGW
jgi:hypothetical protein